MRTPNTERFDEVLKVPNAIVNNENTFYDNTRSVIEKVYELLKMFKRKLLIISYYLKTKWALAHRIGGVFTWDVSLDDFNGLFCSEGIRKKIYIY